MTPAVYGASQSFEVTAAVSTVVATGDDDTSAEDLSDGDGESQSNISLLVIVIGCVAGGLPVPLYPPPPPRSLPWCKASFSRSLCSPSVPVVRET